MSPTLRTACLVVSFGTLFGYGTASIAGVLDAVKRDFALDLAGEQVLVAALVLAAFAGAAAAAPLAARHGRRRGLIVAVTCAAVGFAITLGGPAHGWMLAARVAIGLAIGISSMIVPMYAAEVTVARRRGAVVSLFQLAVTAGIMLAYGATLVLEGVTGWPVILGLGMVPAMTGLAGILMLPESPRWLAARGNAATAERAARDLGLTDEMAEIADARPAQAVRRADLVQGSTAMVLALCSLLFVLQNLSGIDGILYYAPRIFEKLGFSAGTAALAATFGLGLVNFLATIAALLLVDRLGRRPLLIWGSAAMATGLGLVVLAATNDWPLAGLVGLCLYILAFALSLGPLPYVLMSELFPSVIREQGIAAASATSWLFNALVAFTFLSVVEAIGLAATIGIFLVVCLASLAVAVALVPETRARPLESIEADVLAGRKLRRLGAAG